MPESQLDRLTLGDLLRVASAPEFHRWEDQIRRTGGCSNPIHLTGWTLTKDKTTGETLHHYSTETEPGGRLRLACGNRRASRCPSCAWTYAGDTYHLIRAGLAGDDRRAVPATVRDHPRVFATLTAPSFGPVHNRPERETCRCGSRHSADAPELGTALDPETYDYAGSVLFNNHAGDLWMRFTTRLRREIAARAGLTQVELKESARLSYGKVAEFQKRGAIHFHTVMRIDGPDGPCTPPPSWATVDLLTDSIRAAARHSYTSVSAPAADDQPARTFRWGTQLDVRPVVAFGDGSDVTEQAVASYVAKYATKAAENTGTLDRRIGELSELDRHGVPDHARRLIAACHLLDPLYPERRLRAWAHMLGFAVTSRRSPADTRPPSASSARPAQISVPRRRGSPSAWRTASRTPCSSCPTGSTQATATRPANPSSPRPSPAVSSSTAKPPVKPWRSWSTRGSGDHGASSAESLSDA